MAEFNCKNRMAAAALKQQMGDKIRFIKNPKKNNQIFFTCGTITGAVSKKVDVNTVSLEELDYAEVFIDAVGQYIPCLFMHNTTNEVRAL